MKITKIKELLEKGVYTNQEIAELVDCTDRYVRKVKAKLPFALHCEERGIDIDNVDFYWDKTKEYSIKVNSDELSFEDLSNDLIKKLEKHSPKYKSIKLKDNKDEHLFVIDIADAHFNKLASAYETNEEYNIEIAKERAISGVKGLLEKAKNFNIDRILFVIGNDVLHTDNAKSTTTSGTFQDTQGMFYDAFNSALETFVYIIEGLMSDYYVDVVFNPSNHDYMSGWFFARCLGTWFRNSNTVFVDDSIKHRKYYQYGLNMIGTSHGDGAKMQDMPLLMANEAPKMWAETKYRYQYLHHIHHKQVNKFQSGKDYIGVTVEYLRSPSASDSWHYRNGYVGAKKAVEGFLHHKEYGQIGRVTHYF